MIKSFKSRTLKRFWAKGDEAGVPAEWRKKVRVLLDTLDQASKPEDMALTGAGFHALSGDRAGGFALTVSRNWRLTFRWDGIDATDINLEDYHGK